MTKEQLLHDFILLVAWPFLTAVLNGFLTKAGKSEHPLAAMLARVGTQILKNKSSEK